MIADNCDDLSYQLVKRFQWYLAWTDVLALLIGTSGGAHLPSWDESGLRVSASRISRLMLNTQGSHGSDAV